jgi:hypothetical protein
VCCHKSSCVFLFLRVLYQLAFFLESPFHVSISNTRPAPACKPSSSIPLRASIASLIIVPAYFRTAPKPRDPSPKYVAHVELVCDELMMMLASCDDQSSGTDDRERRCMRRRRSRTCQDGSLFWLKSNGGRNGRPSIKMRPSH